MVKELKVIPKLILGALRTINMHQVPSYTAHLHYSSHVLKVERPNPNPKHITQGNGYKSMYYDLNLRNSKADQPVYSVSFHDIFIV